MTSCISAPRNKRHVNARDIGSNRVGMLRVIHLPLESTRIDLALYFSNVNRLSMLAARFADSWTARRSSRYGRLRGTLKAHGTLVSNRASLPCALCAPVLPRLLLASVYEIAPDNFCS